MAKKAAESGKQGAKQEAFDALKGPKPRSAFVDFMVFCGGISLLVYVCRTMQPY